MILLNSTIPIPKSQIFWIGPKIVLFLCQSNLWTNLKNQKWVFGGEILFNFEIKCCQDFVFHIYKQPLHEKVFYHFYQASYMVMSTFSSNGSRNV